MSMDVVEIEEIMAEINKECEQKRAWLESINMNKKRGE